MELTILHLFPDFMSLYGEYANITVLRRHLETIGVSVTVRAVTCEDTPDFQGMDLIYMGAGTERKQKLALEKLRPFADELRSVIEKNTLLIFTGSAMEILGASITDAAGKVWPGLELADFTTTETEKRSPEDVIAVSELWNAVNPAVGFMNKCSVTHGVTSPLFKELLLGFGNEAERGPEGYMSGNILSTHLTGPVLVKNPDFLDYVIRRLFALKGWDCPEELPILPHEWEAYKITRQELQARIGN